MFSSNHNRYNFPVELIDEVISYLFNVPDRGHESEILLRAFRNVSLVNRTFLDIARKRGSRFLTTKRFKSSKRIKEYIRFVKEHPESTIQSQVIAVTFDMDINDRLMSAKASQAFLAWRDLFPNVEMLSLYSSQAYQCPQCDVFELQNAMRRMIKETTKLRSLTIRAVELPQRYFDEIGDTLQSLRLGFVTGTNSKPKRLQRLLLEDCLDVQLAHRARQSNSDMLAGLKELSIQGYSSYTRDFWREAWNFICSFKKSLQSLILHVRLWNGQVMNDPFDLLRLKKLKMLTVYIEPDASTTSTYIGWLSWLFRSVDQFMAFKPTFKFRLLIGTGLNDELETWDTWITDFFPPTVNLEIAVQTENVDEEDYRRVMQNCEINGRLKVIHARFHDIVIGSVEPFQPCSLT